MTEKAKSPGLDWIQLVRLTAPALSALLVKVASTAHAVEKGELDEAEEPAGTKPKGKGTTKKKPAPLPETIMKRLMKVEAATAPLSSALAHREPKPLAANPARVSADREMDNAIRALDGFLLSKSNLPKTKERALKAHKAFFKGEGHDWLNADFETQWADVKARLQLIDTTGIAKEIIAIGGEDVLDHMRDMFKAYGIALGITEVSKQASKVDVGKPYREALDALRRYVAVVVGHGANSDVSPEAGELAEALLSPIEEAREKNAARAARSPKEGGEEPSPDAPKDEVDGEEEEEGETEDPSKPSTGGTD